MPTSTAKSSLRPGTLVAGKYRLLKMLGRGASGVVWSAVNTSTSRKVALKLLLKPEPKQVERLLREARAAGALHHPNVVDVYDVTSLEDGSPVLVLELLEGETLQQLIDERAPLPQHEAAAFGRDVARALAVAHASGIVHRDLKPANIFLHRPGDDPPVVKVVDFGISKNLLAAEGTLTETGMAVGSPAFMSPEQVRGERNLDGRTDMWALGVILYEMLAGKRLFDGRTHEVLTQVLVEPIKSLDKVVPGVDPVLTELVSTLLERDQEKRLASADYAAERLSIVADVREMGSLRPPSMRPSTYPAPASVRGAPPSVRGAPPSVRGAPPSVRTVPPSARTVPPSARTEPLSALPAPLSTRPAPPPGGPPGNDARRDGKPAAPAAPDPSEPHDTTVVPRKMSEPKRQAVPKAYVDDDEDEPTHVAPFSLRKALAQKTVPKVYADDDEEEDRTRVAADDELTAAVAATRVPLPVSEKAADPSQVPTVRPPSPSQADGMLADVDGPPPTPRAPEPLQVAEAVSLVSPASDRPRALAKADADADRPPRVSVRPPAEKPRSSVRPEAEKPRNSVRPEAEKPRTSVRPPAEKPRNSVRPEAEKPSRAPVRPDEEERPSRTSVRPRPPRSDAAGQSAMTASDRTPVWVWVVLGVVVVLAAVLLFVTR